MSISTQQISQELNEHKASTKLLKGKVERGFRDIRNVMVAVIVVLVVAFISLMITVQGLVFSYQHDSQDVYKQSRDATNAQNDKIEALTEELRVLNEQKAVQTTN